MTATLSSTPKRPRKKRKASKAVQGRLVEFLFNDKIATINESDSGEVSPSDDIFISSRANGGYKVWTQRRQGFRVLVQAIIYTVDWARHVTDPLQAATAAARQ